MKNAPMPAAARYTFDLSTADEGSGQRTFKCLGTFSDELAEWLHLVRPDADAGRRAQCLMSGLLLMMNAEGWHPGWPECRELPLRFSLIVDGDPVAVVARVPRQPGPLAVHLDIDVHANN